jgi:hypothetical protein
MRHSFALFSAALLALAANSASGTIIGGSVLSPSGAGFVKLNVPLSNPFGAANSVGNDNFQSRDLYGFDESQNIVLTAPLTVDTVRSGASNPLPVGTTVASHYIFFDPVDASIDGTVDFDASVLAIISSTALLAASDHLANTGVHYLNPAQRGLEAGDFAVISGQRQIRLTATASSPGDYIRVLTEFSPAAVPEPASLVLLMAGAAAFIGLCLKNRSKPALTHRAGACG